MQSINPKVNVIITCSERMLTCFAKWSGWVTGRHSAGKWDDMSPLDTLVSGQRSCYKWNQGRRVNSVYWLVWDYLELLSFHFSQFNGTESKAVHLVGGVLQEVFYFEISSWLCKARWGERSIWLETCSELRGVIIEWIEISVYYFWRDDEMDLRSNKEWLSIDKDCFIIEHCWGSE